MPLVKISNNTNRVLGFHDASGQLIELLPKKSIGDIELSAEALQAIKAASDLTFKVSGESELDFSAKAELSEKLSEELKKVIADNESLRTELTNVRGAAQAVTEGYEQRIALHEHDLKELKELKGIHELALAEIEELKKAAAAKEDNTGKKGGK